MFLSQVRCNLLQPTAMVVHSQGRVARAMPKIASLSWKIPPRRDFSLSVPRCRINKVIPSAAEAIEGVQPGHIVLCGGFGLCGVPDTLINEIHKKPLIKNLTGVSNNAGIDGSGLGLLLESGQIKKMISSYIGNNKIFGKLYNSGALEVELTPQGTLAERCRAGGAGIPAFYTPAAVGTVVQTGDLPTRYDHDGHPIKYNHPKEIRVFNGKQYIMEEAIQGDVALVKAWKADRLGNCQFRNAAANFNGPMARNAKLTIVEAEHIVEVGELDPNLVHLPGIYVDRVIQSQEEKKIEIYTNTKPPDQQQPPNDAAGIRRRIARRAAREFKNGMYVNLGIGIPVLSTAFLDPDVEVQLHSENGILGVGPYPFEGEEDPDIINASKETTTVLPGASFFGSDESFGMVRAGKIDMTVLGAMQVSATGDLANWMVPGKIKGFGGALDLVSNPEATRVVVTMEHIDKKGRPKIVNSCSLPLTGRNCVSKIITDLAVFEVNWTTGLTLTEIYPGVTIDQIKAKTEAPFQVADNVQKMF